jgi:hypothetical protein
VDIIQDWCPYSVIGAPFTVTGADHIPERDPVQHEFPYPVRVREVPIDAIDRFDDLPEMVLGISVIFRSRKRLTAGKTAENEDFGGFPVDRVKTGTALRFQLRGYTNGFHCRVVKKEPGFWSGFFEIEMAVALTVMLDFVTVVDARALDRPVLLLITTPETAGTVGSPELLLVPDEPPDDRMQLFLIRVEHPAMLVCKPLCPFQHIRFSSILFRHSLPAVCS